MPFFVILIIVGIFISNLNKQAKAQNARNKPPVGRPAQKFPDLSKMDEPFAGEALPDEGRDTAEWGEVLPNVTPAEPLLEPAKPLTEPLRFPQAVKTMPDEAFGNERTTAQQSSAGEDCQDGYGSILHNTHEGVEFHEAGTHSALAKSAPGSLAAKAAAPDMAMAAIEEDAPELLGMKLDEDTMRRAVVFSEIINKRGGRHGWVRT